MRNIIAALQVSLDGFIEGANGEGIVPGCEEAVCPALAGDEALREGLNFQVLSTP